MLLYLNEGYGGGETRFKLNDTELTMVPKAGMALFFTHILMHEGAAVETGRKYVLRTDVMYCS